MIFDLNEVVNFTTQDLKAIQDTIKLTLDGRRRESLARFRTENPVLGMALRDEDRYLGFYEVGAAIPQFALNVINRDLESGWVVDRIYNQDLVDLLLESHNDREHPPVFYNPTLNTANGQEWIDNDLLI